MKQADTADALLIVGLLLIAVFVYQSNGWWGIVGLAGGLCIAFAVVLAQKGPRRG